MSHVRNIGMCSAGTWVDTVDISLAYARAYYTIILIA